MEKRYTVAQAAEMTGVRSYVLRYWEEELNLRIGRNELGHRCYTGYDIQLFMNIKELKNRGLQLKAIRELLPRIAHNGPGSTADKVKLLDGEVAEVQKPAPGEEKNSSRESGKKEETTGKTRSEKILEFQEILERLIMQEMQTKDAEELRCRSLDKAIRRQQLARKEAAAASEKKNKKKHRMSV